MLLPSIHTNLENVMERPFGALQFSQASVAPLGFLDTSSTASLREWMYQQVIATGLGAHMALPLLRQEWTAEMGAAEARVTAMADTMTPR